MKCQLLRDMGCQKCEEFPAGVKPKGTVIDHPDAWRLVRMGVAYPADAECRDKAAFSDDQIAEAARTQDVYDAGLRGEEVESKDLPRPDVGSHLLDAEEDPVGAEHNETGDETFPPRSGRPPEADDA